MAAEASLSKPLYKIELYLLKVIPMVIAALCLANTTLFYFGIDATILTYMGGVSFLTLGNRKDVGFTYTDSRKRTSIVGITATSSQEQFLNTLVHEAKHVQSHICAYYNVPEDGEQAAYLIGYLIQKMHRVFTNLIERGAY